MTIWFLLDLIRHLPHGGIKCMPFNPVYTAYLHAHHLTCSA